MNENEKSVFELPHQREGETPESLFLRDYETIHHHPDNGAGVHIKELTEVDPLIAEFIEKGTSSQHLITKYLEHKLNKDEYRTLSEQFVEYAEKRADAIKKKT